MRAIHTSSKQQPTSKFEIELDACILLVMEVLEWIQNDGLFPVLDFVLNGEISRLKLKFNWR